MPLIKNTIYIIAILAVMMLPANARTEPRLLLGDPAIRDTNISFTNRGVRPWQHHIVSPVLIPGAQTMVNTVSGNLFHRRRDIEYNTPLCSLAIEFAYNSGSFFEGRFGSGWQMNLAMRYVENEANRHVIIVGGDDATDLYLYDNGIYRPSYGAPDSLESLETGYRLICFRDGIFPDAGITEYYFDAPEHNYLTRIATRDGRSARILRNRDLSIDRIVSDHFPDVEFFYENNLLNKIEFNGISIRFEYDDSGRLIAASSNSGAEEFRRIEYDYTEDCDLMSLIRFGGHETEISYDGDFGVSKMQLDGKRLLSFGFDYDAGNCEVRRADSAAYVFAADANGRTNRIKRPDARQIVINRDERWRLTTYRNAANEKTNYLYDRHGNIIRVIYPNGREVNYDLDYELNKISQISENGKADITFEYSPTGRLINYSIGETRIESFTYDAAGRTISETDRYGNTRRFWYDQRGFPSRIEYPDASEFHRINDEFGRPFRITAPSERRYSIDYDAAGRPRRIGFPDTSFIEYIYNECGNIISIGDKMGAVSQYNYDPFGRMITAIGPETDSAAFGFNNSHILRSLELSGGRNYLFSFDSLNNLSRAGNPAGHTYGFEYDGADRCTRISAPGTPATDLGYDESGSLTSLVALPRNILYEYYPDGKIRRISAGEELTSFFYYDELDRLVEINQTVARISLRYGREFDSIAVGGIVPGIINYFFDPNGRLSRITDPINQSFEFSYNAAGDVIRTVDFAADTTRYEYDNSGTCIRKIYPDGSIRMMQFDKRGDATGWSLPTGLDFRIERNRNGRIARIIDSEAGESIFEYNAGGFLRFFRDRCGFGYDLEFNPAGNPTTIAHPSGAVFTYNYGRFGYPISALNSGGDLFRIDYSSPSVLNSLAGPMGDILRIGSNAFIFPEKISEGDAVMARYIYGRNNRLITSRFGNDEPYSFGYDSSGHLIRIVDPMLNTYYIGRYADGKIRNIQFPMGDSVVYEYVKNLMSRVSMSGGRQLIFEHDSRGRLYRIFNGEGDACGFRFDDSGNLIKKFDESDNSYIYNYDIRNRLTNIKLPGGVRLEFEYDQCGGIRAISLPDSENYLAKPNEYFDMPDSVFSPSGWSRGFEYDAYGNLINRTNRLGLSEVISRDRSGRISRIEDSEGGFVEYTYNKSGNPVSIQTEGQNFELLRFDSQNRLKTVKFTRNDSITFMYSPRRKISEIINQNGYSYKYIYDKNNRQKSLLLPDGSRYDFAWEPFGRIGKLVDGNGNITEFGYDNLSRLVSLTKPRGIRMTFLRGINGRLNAMTGLSGALTAYEYDNIGNLIKSRDNNGYSIEFHLSEWGNPITMIDKHGIDIHFGYDRNNHISSFIDRSSRIINMKRNAYGQLTALSTRNLSEYEFEYSPGGSIMFSSGPVSKFFYNSSLNGVSSLRLDGRPPVEFGYDRNLYCNYISSPSDYDENYFYDPAGNLFRRMLPSLGVVSYNYLPGGLPLSAIYSTGDTLAWGYDSGGWITNIRRLNDASSNILINRDDSYFPEIITVNFDNRFVRYLEYDHDAAGNCTSINNMAGSGADFEYDDNNNLRTIRFSDDNISFARNNSGEITQEIFPNGIIAEFERNDRGMVSRITLLRSNGDTIRAIDYAYDSEGNLVYRGESTGEITRFVYDAASRLINSLYPRQSKYLYNYDAAGNPVEVSIRGKAIQYAYNADNWLLSASGHTFSFDNLGALILDAAGNDTTFYEYDHMNRLCSVVRGDTLLQEYAWFAVGDLLYAGSRMKEFYYPYNASNRASGRTNPTLSEIYDSLGNPRRHIVYIPDGGDKLRPVFINDIKNSKIYYLHSDHFGNVLFVSDRQGNIISENMYSPFGKPIEGSDLSWLRFGSMEYFQLTGLYRDGSRFWSPELMRWLTPDPEGYENSYNSYIYPGNNPFRHSNSPDKHSRRPDPVLLPANKEPFAEAIRLRDEIDKVSPDSLIMHEIRRMFGDIRNFNLNFSYQTSPLGDGRRSIIEFPGGEPSIVNIIRHAFTPAVHNPYGTLRYSDQLVASARLPYDFAVDPSEYHYFEIYESANNPSQEISSYLDSLMPDISCCSPPATPSNIINIYPELSLSARPPHVEESVGNIFRFAERVDYLPMIILKDFVHPGLEVFPESHENNLAEIEKLIKNYILDDLFPNDSPYFLNINPLLDIRKPGWKIYHPEMPLPESITVADSIARSNRRNLINKAFSADPIEFIPGLTQYEADLWRYVKFPTRDVLPPDPTITRRIGLRELFRLGLWP